MTTFDQIGINPQLIEGLKKANITEPTDIQAKVIPLALKNQDVIGQSQTGSGKTLAYLLPLFQKIDCARREMQAFVLAPTHELVMQIDKQIRTLAENSGIPITSTPIIGDVNIARQIEALREKPHIIVASVGRLQELISKKKINSQTIKTIVIDEGDRLLDQNDVNRVKAVIKTTMKDRQMMVFAAHIDNKTLAVAKELMNAAEVIKIEEQNLVNQNISHVYFMVDSQRDKFDILRKLIAAYNIEKAIVFINNIEAIERTTEKLLYHQYKVFKLSGSIAKEERHRALEGFRSGAIKILIASDIAGRGLDIQNITHVINLDLPEVAKEYLNRAGRTGRSGQKGTAVSIVTERELLILKRFERELNIKIDKKRVYGGSVV